MTNKSRQCVRCGATYTPYHKKPGLITECGPCGQATEDSSGEEKLGGNMIYAHKTGGVIEIKPLSEAQKFADKTKRLGAGVTASITQSKLSAEKQVHGQGTRWNGTTIKGNNKE